MQGVECFIEKYGLSEDLELFATGRLYQDQVYKLDTESLWTPEVLQLKKGTGRPRSSEEHVKRIRELFVHIVDSSRQELHCVNHRCSFESICFA